MKKASAAYLHQNGVEAVADVQSEREEPFTVWTRRTRVSDYPHPGPHPLLSFGSSFCKAGIVQPHISFVEVNIHL